MNRNHIAVIILIIIFAGFMELNMDRTLIYKYGPVRLWSGDINSNQNSQQIADPYTFTHIIHGFGFYALASLIPTPLSLGTRAIIAIAGESLWEVIENTDMVINRYRAATISLDYYGDSVINSVFDILAALLGFWIASRARIIWTIVLMIVIEVILLLWIRDSLVVNIIMLLYPISAIKIWQAGL